MLPLKGFMLTGGILTVIAGSLTAGFLDGTGLQAQFSSPSALVINPHSNLVYITDSQNNRIRVVTTPTGLVSTLAGNGMAGDFDGLGDAAGFNQPMGIVINSAGTSLFVTCQAGNTLRQVL